MPDLLLGCSVCEWALALPGINLLWLSGSTALAPVDCIGYSGLQALLPFDSAVVGCVSGRNTFPVAFGFLH